MKNLVHVACLGLAFFAKVGAADVFSEGEKLYSENKKPVIVRVNKATDEAALFKADLLDGVKINTMASATTSEMVAKLSETLSATETKENQLPLYTGPRRKDESTPASYGYYYGYYPWIYYRPIYLYRVVTVTYVYVWHIEYRGYIYYFYN